MASHLATLLGQALAFAVAADVVYVPSFSKYPDYTGALEVAGSVTLVGTDGTDTTSKQALTWSLTGLDTACTAGAADSVVNGCGIHIHTGADCGQAGGVGGHYYSGTLGSDPWLPIVYEATANGTSNANTAVEVVTGLTTAEITGRVMVVHALDSGARIACGVIFTESGDGPRTYVASFAPYPEYTVGFTVAGSMTVMTTGGSSSTAKQTLTWSLSGLDPACAANAADSISNGCGIHIHSGTSCATAANVGGHYYSPAVGSDPWGPIVYVSADGTSNKNVGVAVVTGLSAGDITGRVMVVHKLDGARIACGVIGAETGAGAAVHVSSLAKYPEYSGALAVAGSMQVTAATGTESTAALTMKWDLSGLDTACVANAADSITNGCGIHVHTGTSCATAADVGGHYYSSALGTDPWLPIVYVAGGDGASKEDSGVQVVTGLSAADITGRVMVVHDLNGSRIACGVVELGASAVVTTAAPVFADVAPRLGLALPLLLLALGASVWGS